jgi:pimeloyl-ACP methyl ester carboxylesterase
MGDTTIQTRDGRTLTFRELGDPSGRPLFYLHGSPGSRLLHGPDVDHTELGIRLITYDRPGYGKSERRSGRTVADAVPDILDIADHLSLGDFGVLGVSGGGPHALAAAAHAANRVSRCGTALGIGPADADDLDFYAGMDPAEVKEWQLFTGPDPDRDHILDGTREWIDGIKGNPDLPEQLKASLVAAFTEAFRTGADGILDDYLALSRPWGFDLAAVTCPITVMVAEQDISVPPAHGRWLAERLPPPGLLMVSGGHIASRPQQIKDLMVWAASRE